jgi:hypothetical protein
VLSFRLARVKRSARDIKESSGEVRTMGGIFNKMFSPARCLKLAIFIVCSFSTPSNAEAQSQSYFGRTTDPTPVDIAIQDKKEIVHLTIPKVFMTFSKNWDGGLQSGITLEVIYPSMAALSATRNSSSGPDVVIINLFSFANRGADYSIPKMLPKKISSQWAFVQNITDNERRSYRVYVNKGDVEKRKDQTRLVTEFLVPDSNEMYFECIRDISNPHVGCNATVNYGENLVLNFLFKRAQFERWPDMREAVFKLLNSFRQPA